jgi:lysophospholipase L1-like esterase
MNGLPSREFSHVHSKNSIPMPNCLSFHSVFGFLLFSQVFCHATDVRSQPVVASDDASTEVSADESSASVRSDWLTPAQRKSVVERWEDEITKLETLDQTEADPENAVLLVGSSSIRLWDDAAEALAPYPVIRRGYGGAKFSDLYVYAKRLIEPHQYRATVIFVANDISGGKGDHEVADVEKWVRSIVDIARKHQPEAAILLVEVTPTPSRYQAWRKIRKLNEMLREVALTEPNVFFVATAEFYLDRDDQPRADLFRDDNLHQNQTGYDVWASLIKRRLDEVLATE